MHAARAGWACLRQVDLRLSAAGLQCRPSCDKVARWSRCIQEALDAERLQAGDASKLAGRLSWGCSQLFHRQVACLPCAGLGLGGLCACRFGRAMLRPLFDQKSRRDGRVSPELARALGWWLQVLKLGLAETREWKKSEAEPAHLFCDARGQPPHLGAVVFLDGRCWWTHWEPPRRVVEQFRRRRDQQIMGLELLAISLGMCTFASLLVGRRVVVHSDNTGSEACFRRGTARSWDHAQLVHEQWLQAARLRMQLFVKRVATDDNIADLPSREVGFACTT